MAKFHLKVIPRQAEYGTSRASGDVAHLSVSGVWRSLEVGNPSINPNPVAFKSDISFSPDRESTFITFAAKDENFQIDIFFDAGEKRKSLRKMYIQNVKDEDQIQFRSIDGKPITTLFVRSWNMGSVRREPYTDATFIEGLQIDYRYARAVFDTHATEPGQFKVHPLERYIGPDDVPNDGQEEPMQ